MKHLSDVGFPLHTLHSYVACNRLAFNLQNTTRLGTSWWLECHICWHTDTCNHVRNQFKCCLTSTNEELNSVTGFISIINLSNSAEVYLCYSYKYFVNQTEYENINFVRRKQLISYIFPSNHINFITNSLHMWMLVDKQLINNQFLNQHEYNL